MKPYCPKIFQANKSTPSNSPTRIVPIMMSLVAPKSVLDVGCGSGSWLAAFKEAGVEDILGIDAPWIALDTLQIPRDRFLSIDLEEPFDLKRRFDLVLALEVGEHLSPDSAETFIESLTRSGGIILFSAAIPFQGGTHHVNEQWPEYWVEKFRTRNYRVIDCLRKRIWNDPDVAWWYAQNTMLFGCRDLLVEESALRLEWERTSDWPLSLVHPLNYLRVAGQPRWTFSDLLVEAVERLKRMGKRGQNQRSASHRR
jgi:SAM-dependent methyltransferase